MRRGKTVESTQNGKKGKNPQARYGTPCTAAFWFREQRKRRRRLCVSLTRSRARKKRSMAVRRSPETRPTQVGEKNKNLAGQTRDKTYKKKIVHVRTLYMDFCSDVENWCGNGGEKPRYSNGTVLVREVKRSTYFDENAKIPLKVEKRENVVVLVLSLRVWADGVNGNNKRNVSIL